MIVVRLQLPGALAVSVDRALHLDRAAAHAGERVGDTGAGVVVEVHGDAHDVVPPPRSSRRPRGRSLDLVRQRAAVGVAQHEARRTLLGRGLEHAER